MGNEFVGVIIEESLENKAVLKKVKVTSTEIDPVTERSKTPWVENWTLDTVEIPENKASKIAKELSESLDSKHNWYADFKNGTHHYIIFRNRVFYIDRTKKVEYERASQYGISLGIPDYQVDFTENLKTG